MEVVQACVLCLGFHKHLFLLYYQRVCRSQWRALAAARLLRFRVRIPPAAWMSVFCERCVLSGRSLCVGLITRPEESYRLVCLTECDREASTMRRPWPNTGCRARKKKSEVVVNSIQFTKLFFKSTITHMCIPKYHAMKTYRGTVSLIILVVFGGELILCSSHFICKFFG
jgi:hypothetical protein